MYIIWRCDFCGHTEEGTYNRIDELLCPDCNIKMIAEIDNEDLDEEINELEDKIEDIKEKKKQLKILFNIKGNDELWQYIEEVGDYQVRTFYRQLFLDINGKIPERSIDI